ncbi:hypothetical protein [Candidatus Similichlamydia laticola]|uniref:Uncharacterized protein n=1 Tax=Candidatus Similichlamydia laticola TaxID=2170265 RepID=A0A369KA84_9BACT|nr:hypothetical protein [Candidatus Similichlamydia laticola]RDB31511.1 hypothetical protein HAT2_00385 [Candidatus Similichlamydia laticola]
MNRFSKNLAAVCFSSLYMRRMKRYEPSLLELPSLEVEKRIDVLPLSKGLLKTLRRTGFLRIRDILNQMDVFSFREMFETSDWECLLSELATRSPKKKTRLFENRKLLVLILTELVTLSPRDVDSLSDKDLMGLCSSSVHEASSLSASSYVALVRWLENILQTATNHLLVPWLRHRGGIGTAEEITYWMYLRSEEPTLCAVLNELLVKGFMWDPFIWGPYLRAVKLKTFERVFWYVIDKEEIDFLQSLFDLLNLCFYKRGQLYKFEYILQLVEKNIAPSKTDLRNILVRLFASVPGLRMVRDPECLLIEKTGSSGFFLDQ